MTTYTPGPWTNHGRIKQAGLPHSAVAAKTLIARVYSEAFGDSEQETANALLIAAAPELLEVLQYLAEKCEESNDAMYGTLSTSFIIEMIAPVIAKATGPT